jgi:septum formation protein
MYKLTSPLVLASASPRRRELLSDCGIAFEISSSDLDESVGVGEDPKDLVLRLAEAKAREVASKFPDSYILGADTDVALGTKIFGKPQDPQEVVAMLDQLSGRTHQVLGGVALVDPKLNKVYTGLSTTSVTFRRLSIGEMQAYAATKEPYDKAGGYAAQGLGASFITIIEGSYTNVVGLDLSMVLGLFREASILKEFT